MSYLNWWEDPENAKVWLRRENLKYYNVKNEDGLDILVDIIKKNKPKTVLEIGFGSGRLVGKLSKMFPKIKFFGLDINSELATYVTNTYDVKTFVRSICDVKIENAKFDLVYSFQVLQHISPEKIDDAINGIIFLAKKEICLMEGWADLEKYNLSNGYTRSRSDSGTFNWEFEKFFNCYETGLIHESLDRLSCLKYYKIKV